MNYTLLLHSFISVLLILLLGICLGFFFSYLRNFAARHNPFGANLINYITFVGVMHHELSHALLAFLSGAKVTEIKLFRIHHNDGALGYVAYAPRGNFILQSIQKVVTSIAPIICGFISCSLLFLYVQPLTTGNIGYTIIFYLHYPSYVTEQTGYQSHERRSFCCGCPDDHTVLFLSYRPVITFPARYNTFIEKWLTVTKKGMP